jgi:hypothetical protein
MRYVHSLLPRKIEWQKKVGKIGEWYAIVEGDRCELTLNDFPDEPAFTVSVGDQTLDIEDLPTGWIVPHGG